MKEQKISSLANSLCLICHEEAARKRTYALLANWNSKPK
jgi:hypothetical protein